MPITDTPLRYPGGKTQLTPFVAELLRTNDLAQCVYSEPFAGGAGIACRLLVTGLVSEIWLNDIDRTILAFWRCVLYRTEELCDRIESTPVTMHEWRRQRAIHADPEAEEGELGFATLFMNRTNRSGILRGGVIGGQAQAGNYPLDCRFDRVDLVRKIRRIALYREQIKVSGLDARRYITTVLRRLPDHALVNVDPPYYRQGPDLYTRFYTHKDHVALSRAVLAMRHRWMLTYDDVPQVRELYDGLPQYGKTLTYYAHVKRPAVELLVLSRRLQPPPSLLARALDPGRRESRARPSGASRQSAA